MKLRISPALFCLWTAAFPPAMSGASEEDFKNEKIVADIIYDLAKSHTIVCATHKEIIKEKASKKVLIEYGKIIS